MSEHERLNVPLLRKAVEWVEEQAALPEEQSEWYQGTWRVDGEMLDRSCGTAYCMAGYIGQLLDERYRESQTVDGMHVADFAGEALGLERPGPGEMLAGVGSMGHAFQPLFHASNTVEDIRRIAERLAGGPL